MSKEDEPTLRISLTVKDSAAALDFYTRAFGAKELYRLPIPNGGIAHAEFMIGNTLVFISDEYPPYKALAMPEGTTSSCLLCIEAPDCDAAYDQAVAAGATSIQAPKDEFWGMRTCVLADPFGFRWSVGQVLEVLSPEEVMKRAQAAFGSGS